MGWRRFLGRYSCKNGALSLRVDDETKKQSGTGAGEQQAFRWGMEDDDLWTDEDIVLSLPSGVSSEIWIP